MSNIHCTDSPDTQNISCNKCNLLDEVHIYRIEAAYIWRRWRHRLPHYSPSLMLSSYSSSSSSSSSCLSSPSSHSTASWRNLSPVQLIPAFLEKYNREMLTVAAAGRVSRNKD